MYSKFLILPVLVMVGCASQARKPNQVTGDISKLSHEIKNYSFPRDLDLQIGQDSAIFKLIVSNQRNTPDLKAPKIVRVDTIASDENGQVTSLEVRYLSYSRQAKDELTCEAEITVGPNGTYSISHVGCEL